MRNGITSTLKSNFKLGSVQKYHLKHKKAALETLKTIESQTGRVDRKSLKLSDEYASDVLGWKGYAPWLYVYSAIAGEFRDGWIPDNYYGKVVTPSLKGDYGKMCLLRPLSGRLFQSNAFPDLACFVNGLFFSKPYNVIKESGFADFLFSNDERVVFKSDRSIQGRGVAVFTRKNFDLNVVKQMGNGVFQEYIEQHGFFKDLTPSSVATLRMTTVIDQEGNASIRTSYLRLAQGRDTHVRSINQVRIPIDITNGNLSSEGYLPNWLTVNEHPDNEIKFEGKRVPMFADCVQTVLDLHKKVPFNRCVGWDVTVDCRDEVKVMEWNGRHNDIKFSEGTQGPCFADLGWAELWR